MNTGDPMDTGGTNSEDTEQLSKETVNRMLETRLDSLQE
jgi:hypothetical protein